MLYNDLYFTHHPVDLTTSCVSHSTNHDLCAVFRLAVMWTDFDKIVD